MHRLTASFPLYELSQRTNIAGANIEGYRAQLVYNDSSFQCKWVNMVAVLDNPFAESESLTFEQLTQKMLEAQMNSDMLIRKESLLRKEGYNVEKVDAVWLQVITFYIDLLEKTTGPKRICIQIHRGSQGIVQAHYLAYQLGVYYGQTTEKFIGLPKNKKHKLPDNINIRNIELQFTNGYWSEHIKPCEGADYHISIGLVIGLNPNIKSGTLLIPYEFTQLDIKQTPHIYRDRSESQIKCKNDLVQTFQSIQKDADRFTRCADITGYEGKMPSKVPIVKLAKIDDLFSPTPDAPVKIQNLI